MLSLADVSFSICNVLRKGKPGTYLEVGANDGVRQSNTLQLEVTLGWAGILIEPSPAFLDLRKNRSGKNYFAQTALVSKEETKEVKGLFSGTLTDSADPQIIDWYRGKPSPPGGLRERVRRVYVLFRKLLRGRRRKPSKQLVTVPASTLSEVVADSRYQTLDFVSLDVEGFELEVLKGFDFSQRPRVWVVETRLRDALEISAIFLRNGYLAVGIYPEHWRPQMRKGHSEYADFFWLREEDAGLVGQIADCLRPAVPRPKPGNH